ncbi:cobalt-precorrin-6A reductase [Pseudorhodobacter sp. MZDSW-24AT]|uniref:cobalt-precorrin-6A reductase n=1 Tax=Pseudorhodobacter sp. MZDSW-24AT TaxID=2052957 RepID=UPI000C1E6FA9|nr:cobalt-precorrin-6A reductase [Pseudorhodobacter sp. MZDSW-24AT]PJF11257.1 cobalt-precorrin-6A reductase [Pseudorhodobacter sp. MZDSW-24AT]
MTRILLLGGTTEASLMARELAQAGVTAVFSYAGRTEHPVAQPLPMRVGGFGGVAGLVAYLKAEGISHVIDATHPFAAQMSRNAIAACAQTGTPLIGLERAPWQAQAGDRWQTVAGNAGALRALPQAPARVFLAIGKQGLAAFAAAPQHHYLLRLVDPPAAPLPLAQATVVIARGPFDVAGDSALLRDHAITHIIAKNAGGSGAEAKLLAARALGLPVILIDRPELPPRHVVASVGAVMAWLGHGATARGV